MRSERKGEKKKEGVGRGEEEEERREKKGERQKGERGEGRRQEMDGRKRRKKRRRAEGKANHEPRRKEIERLPMTSAKRGANLASGARSGRRGQRPELNSGSQWFVYIVGERREELSVGCFEQVGMRGTWGAGGGGGGVRTRALELVHVCFDSLYLLAFHVLQIVSIYST